MQRFMMRFNVVSRRQTGKLRISPHAKERVNRRVAFFLGTFARQFQSGELQEDNIENAGETHFVFNMDSVRTLGFRGDEHFTCQVCHIWWRGYDDDGSNFRRLCITDRIAVHDSQKPGL